MKSFPTLHLKSYRSVLFLNQATDWQPKRFFFKLKEFFFNLEKFLHQKKCRVLPICLVHYRLSLLQWHSLYCASIVSEQTMWIRSTSLHEHCWWHQEQSIPTGHGRRVRDIVKQLQTLNNVPKIATSFSIPQLWNSCRILNSISVIHLSVCNSIYLNN